MKIEGQELSPIENQLLFREWCKREGVNLFLLDGDDTIWKMIDVFRRYLADCYNYLAQNAPFLTRQQWEIIIKQTNDAAFETHAVNSVRWRYVMNEVAQKTGLDSKISQQAEAILMQIYQTPVQFLDKAEGGLDFLKKTRIPFGIVTHANRHWTWQKYQWLNLSRFLDWDMVYTVDENTLKTSQSWLEAINYFDALPESCAVIGDSPRSDINPACQIGVKHCFLIQGHVKIWSIHNQPVDQQTIVISSLGELIGLGQEYLHEFRPQKTITK